MSDLQAQGLAVRAASLALAQATNLQRCAVLVRVADQLEERCAQILEVNARDLEAYQESGPGRDRLALSAQRVGSMASTLREIAATEDPLFETSDHDTRPNGLRVERMRVPLGVVGVVYENRPNVTSDVAGLCVRSGNAAYLRGSSSAMATNELIVSIWRDALELEGLPRDAVALVSDPSYETATAFMQMTDVLDCLIPRGGPSLIAALREHARVPYVLDGDGNCHVYVEEFADLDKALDLLVPHKFRNAGQVCVSPTRFYVQEGVYERFSKEFALRAGKIKVGDGLNPAHHMGPMANHRRPDAIEAFVDDAVKAGARVATGGTRGGGTHDKGYFFKPTVLTDVPLEARVMNEEPFGPIALMRPFKTFDDAIEQANRLPFGLAAYCFTENGRRALLLGDAIESGMIGINTTMIGGADSPFGGVKDSGHGSEDGPEGLEACLVVKAIHQA